MSVINLPIAYEEALKGAKAITIEQTIPDEKGFLKKYPVIIPPLNTNIAFEKSQLFKPYLIPVRNIYNNQFTLPRQQ